MDSINTRIEKVVRYCAKTRKEFAEKIGKSSQWVTNITSEGYPVGKKTITSIIEVYSNIDPNWVLNGIGGMLLKPDNTIEEAREIDPEYMDVEFITKYAYAGYMAGFGDAEFIDTLPKIKVLKDREVHGNYKCFEVKGDSMFDNSFESWLDGDIILCREVKRDLWLPKLHFNQWDFVIVHKDGILLKRITGQNNDKGTISIHSLNPDKSTYPDQEIDLNDIMQIFSVTQLVKREGRR